MILAHHYLTWVTISTHSAIQANNRDPEVTACIQQPTGPTAFVSGILCESYDEQNDSLAYIISEDNVKYFPLRHAHRDRKQGQWRSCWRHMPFTSFSLSIFSFSFAEKNNLKAQLEKSSSLAKRRKKRNRNRKGERGGGMGSEGRVEKAYRYRKGCEWLWPLRVFFQ